MKISDSVFQIFQQLQKLDFDFLKSLFCDKSKINKFANSILEKSRANVT